MLSGTVRGEASDGRVASRSRATWWAGWWWWRSGRAFLLFGRELEVGTSFRMGPGYFPTILSWLMVALGAVMAGLAWRAPHQEGAFGAGAVARPAC